MATARKKPNREDELECGQSTKMRSVDKRLPRPCIPPPPPPPRTAVNESQAEPGSCSMCTHSLPCLFRCRTARRRPQPRPLMQAGKGGVRSIRHAPLIHNVLAQQSGNLHRHVLAPRVVARKEGQRTVRHPPHRPWEVHMRPCARTHCNVPLDDRAFGHRWRQGRHHNWHRLCNWIAQRVGVVGLVCVCLGARWVAQTRCLQERRGECRCPACHP